MTQLRYISDEEVRNRLTPKIALESQRTAFTAMGNGEGILAPRVLVEGNDDSVAFSYVARISSQSGAVTKFGSVNPGNAAKSIPIISASVHVLDAITGQPKATIEATELTTIRTAAASALAVEQLAVENASTLGIIGAGVQAKAHAIAISQVREFSEIRIFSRTLKRAKQLAEELRQELEVPIRVVTVESAAAANVVAACTTSFEPVLETAWIRPGTTVVSVGAFAPDRFELPPSLLDRAEVVVVDHRETCVEQSGSVRGLLEDESKVEADLLELGEVVVAAESQRKSDQDICVFVSVGIGMQDAAAAEAILDVLEA